MPVRLLLLKISALHMLTPKAFAKFSPAQWTDGSTPKAFANFSPGQLADGSDFNAKGVR